MRHSLRSIVTSYKRYGWFSKKELLNLLITSIVFGFIFSFRKWGDASGTYDPIAGASNWIFYTVFSFVGLFVFQSGIHMSCVERGYKPSYMPWHSGLIANLFIAFLTNGLAIFLSPGGFEIRRQPGMQLGNFRQGISYQDRSTAVFWGFFAISVYAAISKFVFSEILGANTFASEMILVAYIIAAWTLFPIDAILRVWIKSVPLSSGLSLFYGGWSKGVGTIVYLAVSFVFIFLFNGFLSILLSLLLAGVAYLTFLLFIDPQKKVYAKFN